MLKLMATLVVAMAGLAVQAQGSSPVEIALTLAKRPVPYNAIFFVNESAAWPMDGHGRAGVRGRYNRVVFFSPGLVHDHPVVRLETLTYGDEACCRRITSSWDLKLDDLAAKGVALPDAATARFEFKRWQGRQAFEFKYGELVCRVAGFGKPAALLSCQHG